MASTLSSSKRGIVRYSVQCTSSNHLKSVASHGIKNDDVRTPASAVTASNCAQTAGLVGLKYVVIQLLPDFSDFPRLLNAIIQVNVNGPSLAREKSLEGLQASNDGVKVAPLAKANSSDVGHRQRWPHRRTSVAPSYERYGLIPFDEIARLHRILNPSSKIAVLSLPNVASIRQGFVPSTLLVWLYTPKIYAVRPADFG